MDEQNNQSAQLLTELAEAMEATAISYLKDKTGKSELTMADGVLVALAAGGILIMLEEEVRKAIGDEESSALFGRYEVVQDDSAHEYFIPTHRKKDWEKLEEEDFEMDNIPRWAERIDGGNLTFMAPKIL